MLRIQRFFGFYLFFALASAGAAGEAIRLPSNPALAPDGKTLVFEWRGDLWSASIAGGTIKRLTDHAADDSNPRFSPDGSLLAFSSERDGSRQLYVMPATGGPAAQITFHTAGCDVVDWFPGAADLLVSGSRDHFWRRAERFFRVSRERRGPEKLLFNDYGGEANLSPDGTKLLFVREGAQWWRKGYHGSQAGQIWLYDLASREFKKLIAEEFEARMPVWKADGKAFLYSSGRSGNWNLWERDLATGTDRQLTRFADDNVVQTAISRDGKTIVFRHLFDFYRLPADSYAEPQRIELIYNGDDAPERTWRRTLTQASAAAFSSDGLEIAFAAGGDLWVMDTELREPIPVTRTPVEEREPVFSPDGETLLFVSDADGRTDVWKAERADKNKFWWLNESFKLTRLTNDDVVEQDVSFSPDGKRIAYVKGGGDLWTADLDGGNPKLVLKSWSNPQYDWSPDGKWFTYAVYDDDFNRDVWITPSDGTGKPFNLSRHPDNDSDPVWSPDGKKIAFTGRHVGEDTDVCFVFLRKQDDEVNDRDRKLEKALEKMTKGRSKGRSFGTSGKSDRGKRADEDKSAEAGEKGKETGEPNEERRPRAEAVPQVVINFEGIHERIRRVAIPDTNESNLFWSNDSKKLAFTSGSADRRGTYTIEVPDNLRPQQLTTQTGSNPRWLANNTIVWLANGVPASFTPGRTGGSTGGSGAPTTEPAPTTPGPGRPRFRGPGAPTPAPAPNPDPTPGAGGSPGGGSGGGAYTFRAQQELDRSQYNRAVFEQCWRVMRDQFYDERLGGRDWNAIREKYAPIAEKTLDDGALATIVNLMLGELNGSHLGFSMGGAGRGGARRARGAGAEEWQIETAHLGVRFDPEFQGPGLKVQNVIKKGPADQERSRLEVGDVLVSIDGAPVGPDLDLTTVLNGRPDREIKLVVKRGDAEKSITIRPTSYAAVRALLYEQWIEDNRRLVEKLSDGKLGYLHIRGMDMPSFYRFEQELYSAGFGKDGLVIDVRENGGGSTTDHLLTALTQPRHAITVPRGGGQGYPQDRIVYAVWRKPIVVLCNQNSFSNAEIFSHAIKTLKRGQLVGVPTAGGVISTGAASIMDAGTLRLPFRGWFLTETGEDMELNGAVPHHIVWPEPGQMPAGKDVQIEKAVAVLLKDVEASKESKSVKLKKASERKAATGAGSNSGGD